jgi:hypothetical protein
MREQDWNEHVIPTGGWQFRQPEINWAIASPISKTLDGAAMELFQQRKKNSTLAGKYNWAMTIAGCRADVIRFNRKRLGLNPEGTPLPFRASHSNPSGGVVAVVADSLEGLKRAASGTAVVIDWLTSGGAPVAQELANNRAAVCVACPLNRPGSWYTVAPAQLIKVTLEARKDLKLETPFDDKLQSCEACKCLMRLKVWVDSKHILTHTKPEVFNDLDPRCWILEERKQQTDQQKHDP